HGPSQPWQPIGTPEALKKVRSLCVANGTLLAGAEPPVLFEWAGRQRWQQLGDVTTTPGSQQWSYPVPTVDVHVRDVAVDPSRPERIYTAIQVGGIALSPDRGSTWLERGNLNLDVHMLETDPNRPGFVLAGAGFDPRSVHTDGLWRSDDYGDTWTSISQGLGNFVVQFAVDPRDSDTIFLGTSRGYPPEWWKNGTARGEMLRTRDGGKTWAKTHTGLPEELESHITAVTLDAGNPRHVFFGGGLSHGSVHATDAGVYHSPDAGQSWRKVADIAEPAALFCHGLD
ncbi:MAG TPA: hypothetical protein VKU60_03215, partial [Chloroflexota bacterium]|nr:hypothetical protein [Chloroflexota bacterium]